MKDVKTEYALALDFLNNSRKLIEKYDKHNAYTAGIETNIKRLFEVDSTPSKESVTELVRYSKELLKHSNILEDSDVEISPPVLKLFGFKERSDFEKGIVTSCWQRDDLVLFNFGSVWRIGVGEPPTVGNESILMLKELNQIYFAKYLRDLLQ